MKDKTWEEEFDNEFHLLCRGEQSIVYASRREIKSFISKLLASQRKKIVLKGERNRVIAQIKDEVKKEIIERLPEQMTNQEQLDFWKKAIKILQKNYGKDVCKELHFDCRNCKAQMMIGFINSEIELLEWAIKRLGEK